MVVQWIRLHGPNAGGPGLIPGQGTRSPTPQLRPGTAKYIYIYILREAKFRIQRQIWAGVWSLSLTSWVTLTTHKPPLCLSFLIYQTE